jgi:hypothetical protein
MGLFGKIDCSHASRFQAYFTILSFVSFVRAKEWLLLLWSCDFELLLVGTELLWGAVVR